MKKLLRSTLLRSTMVLLSVFGVACDTGKPDDSGTLSGVVQEAGSQLPLADVRVMLGSDQTTTGADGRFEFRGVPVGQARPLQALATGFDVYKEQVEVLAGDNRLAISLVRTTYHEFSAGTSDEYGIYLPSGVSTYRGVIFLAPAQAYNTRGFASGLPVGPDHPEGFNAAVAAERQRSLLLAEKYGLALMGADVSTLREHVRVLSALEHFAEESGHPELAQAPLLVMGFSFGGCFAYEFTLHHSERVIGFMSQKGGCHSTQDAGPARLVPGYLFIGSDDEISRGTNITGVFEANRSQGALWVLAVEPGTGHTPVNQDLLFNWMDVVLESRLPETASPGAPVALNALDEASGSLGHQQLFSIARYACYTEDRLQASWLPSMQTAQDWQAFVSSSDVTTVTTCENTP